jgi:translation initiation factor IF-3
VPFVRVIGPDGAQLGILPTREAQQMAREQGLDLVEVQAAASPPVCKIADYGKMQYERGKNSKPARQPRPKEVRAEPNTAPHDVDYLIERARRFLGHGHRTKINVVFSGREVTHPEIGQNVIKRFIAGLADCATPEGHPRMEGRYYSVIMVPNKK